MTSFGTRADMLRSKKPVTDFTPREVGLVGEDIACAFLERKGLKVLEQNWRCVFGEADIICSLDDTSIVLVEVKTRNNLRGHSNPMPEIAVGPAKQARYRNIALCYMNEHPRISSVRFDVVAITITGEKIVHVHHVISAFSWDN